VNSAAWTRASAEEAYRWMQTFAAHLDAMQQDFDYCLLDSPPTLGIRMVAALAGADFVTVPIGAGGVFDPGR
jgi:cellulose biosynthesis protein BcsQ